MQSSIAILWLLDEFFGWLYKKINPPISIYMQKILLTWYTIYFWIKNKILKDDQKNWDGLNEMQRATQFMLPNIALSYILSIKL